MELTCDTSAQDELDEVDELEGERLVGALGPSLPCRCWWSAEVDMMDELELVEDAEEMAEDVEQVEADEEDDEVLRSKHWLMHEAI